MQKMSLLAIMQRQKRPWEVHKEVTMDTNRPNEGLIITGGTINADQIAVGKYAQAIKTANEALTQKGMQEIQVRLDELVQALNNHSDALVNPDEVRDSTAVVAKELSKEKPNKLTLIAVLNGIASSVQSVTAIAVAVEALKNAIGIK
jgi:hypothetical protein